MGDRNILLTDRQKIRDHWKKSEEQLNMEIKMIKSWINTQKHLPEIPSDNMIEFFLTNCKFSIEKTKNVLDMYYTIRDLIPELYENKHPKLQHMKNVFDIVYICPLPKLTESLHRITIIKFKDENTDKFNAENYVAQVFRNIMEIRTKEDLTLGEIFVIDFEFLKLGHVVKITPMLTKKAAFILEKVWSNRLRELHFLNCPPYVDTILMLVKAFLSKKLNERGFYIGCIVRSIFLAVFLELDSSALFCLEITFIGIEFFWNWTYLWCYCFILELDLMELDLLAVFSLLVYRKNPLEAQNTHGPLLWCWREQPVVR